MGFATLVGGMATTIGTSTNLLVVGIAKDLGVVEFSMFDFVLPAAGAGAVALLYLWLIAPRLLPDRATELDNPNPRLFAARLVLSQDSAATGLSVAEARALADTEITIRRILREDAQLYHFPMYVCAPATAWGCSIPRPISMPSPPHWVVSCIRVPPQINRCPKTTP